MPREVLLPLIGRVTGGMKVSTTFRASPEAPNTTARRSFLLLSGKATKSHAVDLWCLLHSVLVDTNFDDETAGLLIVKRLIADRESSLHGAAFVEARRLALSSFTAPYFAEESTKGYRSLAFYREALAKAQADWVAIASRLSAIRERVLTRENLVLNLTDAASFSAATEGAAKVAMMGLIEALPRSSERFAVGSEAEKLSRFKALSKQPRGAEEIQAHLFVPGSRTAHVVPTQVSDLAMVVPFSPPGTAFLGPDLVAVARIELLYLMSKVREQARAYGAALRYAQHGFLSFLSHRDPKVAESVFGNSSRTRRRYTEAL
ncbi:hypothetical protein Esti_006771 [Eimeria stiedai]